jgi:hypothetical protein
MAKKQITDPKLFEGTYPLNPWITHNVPGSCHFYEVWDLDENGIDKNNIMDYESNNKRFPDNMIRRFHADRLYKNFNRCELFGGYGPQLIHEKGLERISKICPNDFQAVQAELIPSRKSKESFLIKDWYVLHFLVRINMLDLNRTLFTENGCKIIKKRGLDSFCITTSEGHRLLRVIGPKSFCAVDIGMAVYHDDRWGDHYLAQDMTTNTELWHPKIAWEFRNTKDIFFEWAGWDSRLPPLYGVAKDYPITQR